MPGWTSADGGRKFSAVSDLAIFDGGTGDRRLKMDVFLPGCNYK